MLQNSSYTKRATWETLPRVLFDLEALGGIPMTLEDKVHDFRLHVLRRAKERGNVSAVCRELGLSRTLYYRWKARLERYG